MKCIILIALVGAVVADVSHLQQPNDERNAEIRRQELDVSPDGAYQWAVETSNGIEANAVGQLKTVDNNAAEVVQGEASWTAPNGEKVVLQYVANENGYQPQGSHIPTPHPIPDYIARSLEFIKANPPKETVK